jgi:hypothetical protein
MVRVVILSMKHAPPVAILAWTIKGTYHLPQVRFFTAIAFPIDTHTTDKLVCHDITKGQLIISSPCHFNLLFFPR